ncbi:MAG: hypothetical protein ACLSGS_04235 [Adlercreutzia sp.]
MVANADGNVVRVSETQPTKGSDVHLAIRAGSVRGRPELAALIAPENRTIGTGSGVVSSVVVMDLRDGASWPWRTTSVRPGQFIGRVDDVYDVYNSTAQACSIVRSRARIRRLDVPTFTGLAALANGFADKAHWTCNARGRLGRRSG